MKRRILKKCMSMLLAGAMIVAAIPMSLTSPVKAAEENILKGKTTKCTYQGDSGHACKKAVDEKLNTSRWGANNKTPQAIQIDMGDVYEIDTIKAYLFGKDRKYTYEYYVTMEPTILKENGGNGDDNFVGKNPVVTGLEGVGYGWADPDGKTPTPESEIRSEDYTFTGEKPVGRYLTLRITKCSHIVCLWDIQAFGKKADAVEEEAKGDIVLEAEKGDLSGKCQTRNANSCSNDQYVGFIGEGIDNTVTWKANVEKAGIYTLDAYFLSKTERSLEFKVNDDAKTTLVCQAGVDWDSTVMKSNNSITVKLKAGDNTIVMGNDEGEAPNVDCIALTFKEEIKESDTEDTDKETDTEKEESNKDTENTDKDTEESNKDSDTENSGEETEKPDTEKEDEEDGDPYKPDTEDQDTEAGEPYVPEEEPGTENPDDGQEDTESKEEPDTENTDSEIQKPDSGQEDEDTESKEDAEDKDSENQKPDTEDKESDTKEPDTGDKESDTKEPDTQKPNIENKEPDSQKPENSGANNNQNTQSPTPTNQQPTPQTPVTEQAPAVSVGEICWYKNLKYKVTKVDATGNGTVELVGVQSKKITSAMIPATIDLKGENFDVTSIGKNAFKNCKKLKKIVINTMQLNKVGKNALKGIKSNARIKVPSIGVNKYTRLFKGKGQGKNVRVVK